MVRIVRLGGVTRRAAAAIPALALATAGIALAASSAPGEGVSGVHVPGDVLAGGASPQYPDAGPAPAPMQLPPIYRTFTDDPARIPVPAARALGAFAPVRLDANGIPAPALAAYHRAADVLRGIDPGCGLDWALLGAIGRVESNHARFGGNVLDTSGIARPGIIGIALDGSRGTARIGDTDNGVWDRDTSFDRAVGPMQFIPGTWRISGQDGDRDGSANPQSMVDAATAAGAYLCSGGSTVSSPSGAYDAVLRYNHSDDYVRSVLSIADAYRRGVAVVPMSAIPAARPASGTGSQTPEGSGFAWGGGTSAPSSRPSSTARPTATDSSRPSPSASSTAPSSGQPEPSPTPTPTRSSAPGLPVPTVPLPSVSLSSPLPSVPQPSATSLSIAELLALPPLPPQLGDPIGLVRVLSPVTGKVVCILDRQVVDCP